MDSFVAIDFETANRNRSSICSVGLVVVKNAKVVDSYYELVKPYPNFYSSWATEIHGLDYFDTINSLNFSHLWDAMSRRIGDLPLIAHNSAFDQGCLRAALSAYGLPAFENSFFCTYRESKKQFPNLRNHRLGTVSEHFGFHLKNHHNALADAEACAHIALNIFN